MNIRIISVKIENFMSIESAELNLDSRGMISLVGINNHDNLSKSNGSGKSALFESILWSLTGSTSRGIKNPSNYDKNEGCLVELKFNIDTNEYVITRTKDRPKTFLSIIKNGQDISGTTLTNSIKVLESELGAIDNQLIRSIMIISQGMTESFTSLTPSNRKKQLEVICNMDFIIDSMKNKIAELESVNKSDISKYYTECTMCSTNITREQQKISDMNSKISQYLSRSKFTDAPEYIKIKTDRSELISHKDKLFNSKNDLLKIQYDLSSKITVINSRINSNEKLALSKNDELQSLDNIGCCPMCKQPLSSNSTRSQLQSKLLEEIIELSKVIESDKLELQKLTNDSNLVSVDLSNYDQQLQTLQSDISKLDSELLNYVTRDDNLLETTNSMIKDSQQFIESTKLRESELTKLLSKTNLDKDMLSFIKSQLSRDFRSYLLLDVVEYLNFKFKDYSKYLFDCNLDPYMVVNGNDLDVYLGNKPYESLSGGEKRRLDILIQLSLRDLYQSQSDITVNLLVLDETLDYLDEVGVYSVLSLLKSKSPSVDTMIVVTHQTELPIPFDDSIVIEKSSDGFSKLVKW